MNPQENIELDRLADDGCPNLGDSESPSDEMLITMMEECWDEPVTSHFDGHNKEVQHEEDDPGTR